MSYSTRCFLQPIRPDLILAAVLLLLPIPISTSAQGSDYFTELEIYDIKMAQDIGDRTQVLLSIADRRLLELMPVVEENDDEPNDDEEGGFGAALSKGIIRILNPEGAAQLEAADEERAALHDDLAEHTRADLLRGYDQALEETMDNIDDAYERNRGDVREPIEKLGTFGRDSLVVLRDLEPQSDAEAIALDDAIKQTELVIEGVAKALKTIGQ